MPRFVPTQFIKPENLRQLKTFKYNHEKHEHYPHKGFQQFMDILYVTPKPSTSIGIIFPCSLHRSRLYVHDCPNFTIFFVGLLNKIILKL